VSALQPRGVPSRPGVVGDAYEQDGAQCGEGTSGQYQLSVKTTESTSELALENRQQGGSSGAANGTESKCYSKTVHTSESLSDLKSERGRRVPLNRG
jgi:hypothetical protein